MATVHKKNFKESSLIARMITNRPADIAPTDFVIRLGDVIYVCVMFGTMEFFDNITGIFFMIQHAV